MRVWDIPPESLCRNHLLGEHREIHAIWSVIVNNRKGYSHHPETLRWKNRLKALYNRHELISAEMKQRGYNHYSTLRKQLARGSSVQTEYVNTIEEQKELLKRKECGCSVG
jgi:hypothetical protein